MHDSPRPRPCRFTCRCCPRSPRARPPRRGCGKRKSTNTIWFGRASSLGWLRILPFHPSCAFTWPPSEAILMRCSTVCPPKVIRTRYCMAKVPPPKSALLLDRSTAIMQSIHQHLCVVDDCRWQVVLARCRTYGRAWPDIFEVIEVVQHAVRLREFRDDEPPTLHRWILLGSSAAEDRVEKPVGPTPQERRPAWFASQAHLKPTRAHTLRPMTSPTEPNRPVGTPTNWGVASSTACQTRVGTS